MTKASERYNKRKKAFELLKNIGDNPSEYLIIHYSCESFYNLPQGNTPRITSIAVRYVKNAQTKSFSIHKIAELQKIPPKKIINKYDSLEKKMLDDYFRFVSTHKNYKWIHINMRNINFGFEAIKHRYKVLGGRPKEINDNLKIDLARLLIEIYGRNYSPHPRMENLYKSNSITMTDFLNGEKEAKAFENGDYVALHRSTLRKVDNIHNIISLAVENDLKTKSNIFQIYGITPSALFYAANDNWKLGIIFFLIGSFISGFIALSIMKLIDKEKPKIITQDKIEKTK